MAYIKKAPGKSIKMSSKAAKGKEMSFMDKMKAKKK